MIRKVTGIVTAVTDYGDADRIIDLVTPDHGKLSTLARGARRSRRRFGGALDAANMVEAILAPGRGELWVMRELTLIHGWPNLHCDLSRLALAAYFCEAVAAFTPADQAEPKMFGLLETALGVVDLSAPPTGPLLRHAFEAKLVTFAGLRPHLATCAVCQGAMSDPAGFSAERGGAVHLFCHDQAVAVPASLLLAIESARRAPLTSSAGAAWPGGPTGFLQGFISWHLGRRLRSVELLARVEQMGPVAGVER